MDRFAKRTFTGFTLIELLIVIAIIAILAAILFPVFATAREKARESACLSNCKQLGIAMVQYATDYDETFPVGVHGTGGVGWGGQIYPYVKSAGVYQCPSDTTQLYTGTQQYSGALPHDSIVSYAANYDVLGTYVGTGSAISIMGHLQQMSAPSVTVLLFEVMGFSAPVTDPLEGFDPASQNTDATPVGDGCPDFQYNGWDLPCTPNTSTRAGSDTCQWYATGYLGGAYTNVTACMVVPMYPNSNSSSSVGRHLNGANYILADGHAKFLLPTLVSPGRNALLATDYQGKTNSNSAAGTAGNFNAAGTAKPAATFSGT
ncbi:MAG: DUF1559 domain-containing protein [Capsulimonadaceae bacterium]|nr:DUF1559 domain-containing protein [Capsulimonadaceae bacterium]